MVSVENAYQEPILKEGKQAELAEVVRLFNFSYFLSKIKDMKVGSSLLHRVMSDVKSWVPADLQPSGACSSASNKSNNKHSGL